MIIPNDIIYLLSEYNCNIRDSVYLSLINREIYNNSDKIFLNDPIISKKNYKRILKYNFNNFKFTEDIIIINPNIFKFNI